MKTFILVALMVVAISSYAIDASDINKGDQLRFLYACKVKEQLGRMALLMEPDSLITVKSISKRIASPPGFLPAIQVNILKFSHEFINRWGSKKRYTFERRSNDSEFYCLEKA